MADQKRNPKNNDSVLFKKLTRMFSGPLTSRRTQTYHKLRRTHLNVFANRFKSLSGQNFKKRGYNPFQNLQTQRMANQNRAERYREFDQMEYCLHGDTKIATPNGYKTLVELVEEHGHDKNETFIVYSYDHEKQEIVPALGRYPRKTRTDKAWKVTFENGQEIIGSSNHKLMMRDGAYKQIDQLKIGDSMMPFYRKDLTGTKEDSGDGYRWIYTMHKDSGRKKGWIAEHILIAEWLSGKRLEKNEVVHHKNFIKYDNTPQNLNIMDNNEHIKYHQNILNEQRKESGWWTNFSEKHSKFMQENNPAYRDDVTFKKILSICENHGFIQTKVCDILNTDPNTIKRRLTQNGFKDFIHFAKTYNPNWKADCYDNLGNKNPRFDSSLTFQDICNSFEKDMNSNELASKMNTTYMKIKNRLNQNGYKSFTDFKENFNNHKIKSVEYYGEIDLYDITVDGYANFATDSVISHNSPEIAAALDIYADEMTTSTHLSPLIRIDCQNEEIKLILQNLYFNVLNAEHNLYYWVRTMCKYGDFFLYCDIDHDYGVKAIMPIPAEEMERLEGEDETNPNYVQFQWNSAALTFENWQILHFRILGHDKYAPYGTGILEPARRIWRQLLLLEDSVMAYRIVRSPERRVFYIDVGSVPPQQVEQYMEEIITNMKRHQIIDEDTGRVDLRYNPLSVDEDYFIPVRGQSQTKIETLPGGHYTGDIDDVKYLQAKLIAALKIPQSYLIRDENSSEDKETLAQKDIRFARTILKLQKPVVSELEKVGIIHLVLLGYSEEDALSFRLTLNNPSKLAELQELEEIRTKVDAAQGMMEIGYSRRYIFEKVFDHSHEEIVRLLREKYTDAKYDAEIEGIASAGELGGDLDLGGPEGDLDLGGGDEDLDLGGPEGDLDLGLGDEDQGEDNALLATPGKRDEYTTPGAKGKKYRPVKDDKRDIGAHKRSMDAKWSKEKSRPVKRNLRAGMPSIAGLTEKSQRPTLLERKMESRQYELRKMISEIRELAGPPSESLIEIEDATFEETDE